MNTDIYIAISEKGSIGWKGTVENWLQYVAKEWSKFRTKQRTSSAE